MRAGRNPAWRLDGAPEGIVFDAQQIDARGRVSIAFLVGMLPWLVSGAQLLAVIDPEPGRVRLVAWENAARVTERLRELSARFTAGDTTTVPELHRLQDRFRRVRVDPDGRIALPLAICVHLGAIGPSTIFIASHADHVELWSLAYRTARLAAESDEGLLP